MVTLAGSNAFADLRKLADWFGSLSTAPQALGIDRLVRRLGATAIPLLGRELQHDDGRRRNAALDALAMVATVARERVVAELRTIATMAHDDEPKVNALGLLAELGVKGAARFHDPDAMQRRSAHELALRLDSAAEIASAADLMVRQLEPTELVQMVAVMAQSTPTAARRLADELAVRLDLDAELRERAAHAALAAPIHRLEPAGTIADAAATPSRAPRPTHVAVLVDAAARLVVIASRKVSGEKRWRRWAVLIGASGRIEDCLHEDDARDGDAAPLIANLCADGYRVASTELDRARTIASAAARLTATSLPPAYYLGRDLLDLGDAHLWSRAPATGNLLHRAIEMVSTGAHAQAEALLARCEPGNPDVAAALAACALATSRPALAIEHLQRAIAVEPAWPLHQWNLAVALHQIGDSTSCCIALRRFVAASATPSGLYADPDQPGRVACAERLLAELDRTARLVAQPVRRKRRKRVQLEH